MDRVLKQRLTWVQRCMKKRTMLALFAGVVESLDQLLENGAADIRVKALKAWRASAGSLRRVPTRKCFRSELDINPPV